VRDQTVGLLRRLGEHNWQRIGTTPTRGTLTIEDYVRYLANHDHEHLEQLQTLRSVVAH
jgi:DinB superfamily